MKKYLLSILVVSLLPVSFSASATNCVDVEAKIAEKIVNNGVPEDSFQLFSIPMDEPVPANGKVVGSCGGGSQQIIYVRGASASTTTPSANENTAAGTTPKEN